jgi:hypothetical protein
MQRWSFGIRWTVFLLADLDDSNILRLGFLNSHAICALLVQQPSTPYRNASIVHLDLPCLSITL